MRLYIPTSSLNADNILSCESIAPVHEYRNRNFGYSHFDVLPELKSFDKVTLAFSKIPTFRPNDYERENFAMVVAIDVDDYKKHNLSPIGSYYGVDIYATATPIQLTPSTTQLIFFDKRAKEYTLHSCADSAKCKLFDFYKSNFVIAESNSFEAPLQGFTEKIDLSIIEPLYSVYSENKFDKVKGFIWGYGMGTIMSITPDAAKLLKIQKRIYDIVSSTKNETDIPTSLSDELTHLDKEYSLVDPNQNAIKEAWTTYIKKTAERFLPADLTVSAITAFLKAFHEGLEVDTFVKNKFLTINQYTLRKKLSDYREFSYCDYELYSHDMANYTNQIINNIRITANSKPIVLDLDVDTSTFGTVMLATADRNTKLFNKILSNIIWNNLIPNIEELRVNKANVAKSVVIAIKSIIEDLGEQWTNTPVQMYFNAMRKNISDFTAFDLNEIEDIVLQSVAAFLLKGEDFNSLKSYLETNAFSNYRYAFALWGAVNGYVPISRSIIETNFSIQEIANLYNQAQKAFKFIGSIEVIQKTLPISQPVSIPTPIQEDAASFRKKVFAFFESSILKNQSKKRRKSLREGLELAFEQFGNDTNSFKFVGLLNDFVDHGWGMKTTAWKTMCDYLEPNYKEKTKHSSTHSSLHKPNNPKSTGRDLFSENNTSVTDDWANQSISFIKQVPSGREDATIIQHPTRSSIFINDDLAVEFVNMLPNIPEDLKRKIIANIRYIQKGYQPGGYYYIRKDSTDNADVINHMIRWCTYEKNKSDRIEKTDYNNSILSTLKELLIKHYCGE